MTDEGIVYRVGNANELFIKGTRFLEFDAAIEDALIRSTENDYVVGVWMVQERINHAGLIQLVFKNWIWYPDR